MIDTTEVSRRHGTGAKQHREGLNITSRRELLRSRRVRSQQKTGLRYRTLSLFSEEICPQGIPVKPEEFVGELRGCLAQDEDTSRKQRLGSLLEQVLS